MSSESFIDTNVFIYQLETQDLRKHEIAGRIVRSGIADRSACTSFQVVQECLNVVLRKAEIPLDAASTRRYLETVLAPLLKVPATLALYQRALDLQARYRYGFYDSLIIAAALDAGCTRLFSENLQHGQRIGSLTIENPFLK